MKTRNSLNGGKAFKYISNQSQQRKTNKSSENGEGVYFTRSKARKLSSTKEKQQLLSDCTCTMSHMEFPGSPVHKNDNSHPLPSKKTIKVSKPKLISEVDDIECGNKRNRKSSKTNNTNTNGQSIEGTKNYDAYTDMPSKIKWRSSAHVKMIKDSLNDIGGQSSFGEMLQYTKASYSEATNSLLVLHALQLSLHKKQVFPHENSFVNKEIHRVKEKEKKTLGRKKSIHKNYKTKKRKAS